MIQDGSFRTALPEVFRIPGIMDTVDLLKGRRLRYNTRNPGRNTGKCCQQPGLALEMARVLVTGAHRINNYRAVTHILIHRMLTGIMHIGFAWLSILCTGTFPDPSRGREKGSRQISFQGALKKSSDRRFRGLQLTPEPKALSQPPALR